MSKLFVRRIILLLGLILVAAVTYYYCIDGQKYNFDPGRFSNYQNRGYYKIDARTILAKLKQGETGIFMPLEDLNSVEALNDIDLSWTQDDFLQIADALSEFVWKEPLDLKKWSVYQIVFSRHCHNSGFDGVKIVYFKTYAIRSIEVDPYFNNVRWGDDTTYYKWSGVNFAEVKITADDALQIAEENGGKETRSKVGNECRIYLSMPANRETNDDRWEVSYIGDHYFEMLIDPYTGEYERVNKDQ